MNIGVFSILYNDTPFDQALNYFSQLGVDAIEIGVAGYSKSRHCDVAELLRNKSLCQAYKKKIEDAGMVISALSVHGNPVHPVDQIAQQHNREYEEACALAEAMQVDTLLATSGTPGGAKGDTVPNWITCPWPDDYLKAYAYQWDDVLIPYWERASKVALSHGVKHIGIEMHPGMCVFNPETLLRLRQAVGASIGCNFDPSHLFWQGIDIPEAIYALKDCIVHFHAKDNSINDMHVRVNGPLSVRHYSEFMDRPWTFRTVGFGHSEAEWKRIIQALNFIQYDGVLSIEHEDALMSRDEGFEKSLKFLRAITNKERPTGMWWA